MTAPLNVTDDYADMDPVDIKNLYIEQSLPEKVVCLNLTGDCNIGVIIRSASLFGLSEVIVMGRRRYMRRPTVGMHKYIPVTFHKACQGHHSEEYDIPEILQALEKLSASHIIVFIEQGGEILTGAFDKCSKPAVFIVGNEGCGIPDEILAFQPSMRVSIPQRGVGRSHNVASATCIVMWEYFRNRI